jgi:hypothetical protein
MKRPVCLKRGDIIIFNFNIFQEIHNKPYMHELYRIQRLKCYASQTKNVSRSNFRAHDHYIYIVILNNSYVVILITKVN